MIVARSARKGHATAALLVALACLLPAVGFASDAPVVSALTHSVSPYLRLHADDPVAWREWHPALIDEARETGRPLLVSSGYFACHWCHVMQEESFRDTDIAERLNRDYIPVKIDRDLHHALDRYLLEFLRATRGSAGWPLNVVVLPTGDALTGLVYAPRDEFAVFLDRVTQGLYDEGDAWTALAREGRIELQARLREGETPLSDARASRLPDVLWRSMEREKDLLAGGFGDQSKFPRVPALEALLQGYVLGSAPDWAEEFLQVTLDEMATAGLRDVIGGGFFRYSETPDWGHPHFEIMLDDQAQLARLYLRAGRVLERPDWTLIGLDALRFVLREMALELATDRYAVALSALDRQGREGGSYLWNDAQIAAALETHPSPGLVRDYFGLVGVPTFDLGYLPKERTRIEVLAERHGIDVAEARKSLDQGRMQLLEARRTRETPRDEKAITGLHGLLLSAFAEVAYEPDIRDAASALAGSLREVASRPTELPLVLGASAGAAELSDIAYLALGLHDWARARGEVVDPVVSQLLEAAWRQFSDAQGWRAALEMPLPGMISERFHPEVHRLSPVTVLLALSIEYRETSATIASRLKEFDLRPGMGIERSPIEHGGLIMLLAALDDAL